MVGVRADADPRHTGPGVGGEQFGSGRVVAEQAGDDRGRGLDQQLSDSAGAAVDVGDAEAMQAQPDLTGVEFDIDRRESQSADEMPPDGPGQERANQILLGAARGGEPAVDVGLAERSGAAGLGRARTIAWVTAGWRRKPNIRSADLRIAA